MINFRNIATVAKYERKTLFRSWFFRIFAILTLLIGFGLNMGLFADTMARWTNRAIPANLPYINVLFVNVAQAIIAVFLASDFLRRDKKLDTTEVIYARPISNGEYVVGKTLGIMVLFIGLVLVVLSMTLIVNLLLKDTPVVWEAYLYYPLLISIPTLVFILGLSFFLMILFRSQAVTFVVLLGYIGLTLFYFRDKLNGLLDYMAFNFPMVYSDFIRFGDLENILFQRMAYLLIGAGCILATIRFLGRLPQVGKWNLLNLAGFLLLIAAGGYLGYRYHEEFAGAEKRKEQYIALNNRYIEKPVVDMISNDLVVEQHPGHLQVSSEITMVNRNYSPIDTLIFSLNPGFRIDSITGWGRHFGFHRTGHLVKVKPESDIGPGQMLTLTFHYGGIPDETVAYLDLPKRTRASLKQIEMATLDKKAGFVRKDFVLLTGELLWYPFPGVGFNTSTYQVREMDFARYSISVAPLKGLTAVVPGMMQESDGYQNFWQDVDLNTLPLIIGPFIKKSISVDDLEINLFYKEDHDFFSAFFPTISDTLASLIREAKNSYEYNDIDLYYSFKRVNLVEVPIQFHAYERPYTRHVEFIQPETILLPEKGAGLNTLDFKRYKNAEDRRNRDRDNARTEEEIEVDLFRNFLGNTFFRSEATYGRGFGGFGGSFGQDGERLVTFGGAEHYSSNPYCVFPFYYNLVTGISSKEYPMFQAMIETYLKEGFDVSPRQGFIGGITDNEKANLALRDKSLTEIFKMENMTLTTSSVYQAGSFILTALKNRVGINNFDNFLYYYLEDHAFNVIPFRQFANDFRRDLRVDIEPYLEFIKSGTELPEFMVSQPEFYQTRDNYGDVYVIRLNISNKGGSTGLIDLNFMVSGQGGFGGGGPSNEHRLYEIGAKQAKEIQLVFYEQPRFLSINTVLSGNIPSTFNIFLRSAEAKGISPLTEYERDVEYIPRSFEDGEIVVDNEDTYFSCISVTNESKLKKYVESRKAKSDEINYAALGSLWNPGKWTPVAHSSMYGETIRSALVSAKGDGGNRAWWQSIMPQAGYYDIYVYIPVSAMYSGPGGDRGDRGENRGGEGGGENRGGRFRGPRFADRGTEYNYVVSSNEGTDEVTLTLDDPEDGWNRLGTFHFPADTVTIELSNNTNGKRVIADAVKWVHRD